MDNIKKKVIISGGWSYGNIGDEVIAMCTNKIFREYAKEIECIFLSYDPEDFFYHHKIQAKESLHSIVEKMDISVLSNIEQLLERSEEYIPDWYLELLKSANFLFMSGGGYWDGNWESQFWSRILEVELAKKYGLKVIIWGQSIGPLKSEHQKQCLAITLEKVDYINVRDRDTLILLEEICKNKEISLCCDLALLISDYYQPKGHYEKNVNLIGQEYATYVHNGRYKINKFDKITKRLLLKKYRYDWRYCHVVRALSKENSLRFIFNVQDTSRRSHKHYRRFANKIKILSGCRNLQITSDKITVEEFCDQISAGSAIISMKLHPIICSVSYGIPAYALSQHYKIDYFMKTIGMGEFCQPNATFKPFIIINGIKKGTRIPVKKVRDRKKEIRVLFQEFVKEMGIIDKY